MIFFEILFNLIFFKVIHCGMQAEMFGQFFLGSGATIFVFNKDEAQSVRRWNYAGPMGFANQGSHDQLIEMIPLKYICEDEEGRISWVLNIGVIYILLLTPFFFSFLFLISLSSHATIGRILFYCQ